MWPPSHRTALLNRCCELCLGYCSERRSAWSPRSFVDFQPAWGILQNHQRFEEDGFVPEYLPLVKNATQALPQMIPICLHPHLILPVLHLEFLPWLHLANISKGRGQQWLSKITASSFPLCSFATSLYIVLVKSLCTSHFPSLLLSAQTLEKIAKHALDGTSELILFMSISYLQFWVDGGW